MPLILYDEKGFLYTKSGFALTHINLVLAIDGKN